MEPLKKGQALDPRLLSEASKPAGDAKEVNVANDNYQFVKDSIRDLKVLVGEVLDRDDFQDLTSNQVKRFADIITPTYERMQAPTKTMAKINWGNWGVIINLQFDSSARDSFHGKLQKPNNLIMQALNNLVLLSLEADLLDGSNAFAQDLIDDFDGVIRDVNKSERFPKLSFHEVLLSNFWPLYPGDEQRVKAKMKNLSADLSSEETPSITKQDLADLIDSFTGLPAKLNNLAGELGETLPAFQVVKAALHNRGNTQAEEIEYDFKNHTENLLKVLKEFEAGKNEEVYSEVLAQWFYTYALKDYSKELASFEADELMRIASENKDSFARAISITKQRHRAENFSTFAMDLGIIGQNLYRLPKEASLHEIFFRPHNFQALIKEDPKLIYQDTFYFDTDPESFDFSFDQKAFTAMEAKLQSMS